jgi:hypothetical protein
VRTKAFDTYAGPPRAVGITGRERISLGNAWRGDQQGPHHLEAVTGDRLDVTSRIARLAGRLPTGTRPITHSHLFRARSTNPVRVLPAAAVDPDVVNRQ